MRMFGATWWCAIQARGPPFGASDARSAPSAPIRSGSRSDGGRTGPFSGGLHHSILPGPLFPRDRPSRNRAPSPFGEARSESGATDGTAPSPLDPGPRFTDGGLVITGPEGHALHRGGQIGSDHPVVAPEPRGHQDPIPSPKGHGDGADLEALVLVEKPHAVSVPQVTALDGENAIQSPPFDLHPDVRV